jgi:hypothetical protein
MIYQILRTKIRNSSSFFYIAHLNLECRERERFLMGHYKMIKYIVAAFIAFGALMGISAKAAPVSPSIVQTQVISGDVVQKVQHWRWGSRGRRWGWRGGHWRWGSRGWHSRWRSHYRWGSGRW